MDCFFKEYVHVFTHGAVECCSEDLEFTFLNLKSSYKDNDCIVASIRKLIFNIREMTKMVFSWVPGHNSLKIAHKLAKKFVGLNVC